MKHTKHQLLGALLAMAVVLCAGWGATSLYRFDEWRGNATYGYFWQCTNATSGEGKWSAIYGTNINGFDESLIPFGHVSGYLTTETGFAYNSSANLMTVENLNSVGLFNLYDVTVGRNVGYAVDVVTGVGGALTNFTLQASADQSIIYVSGATNVNVVAIMGGSASFAYRGTLIVTNRTGTSRTLSLGATTNNWISLQQYDGITAPFTVTNSLAGRLDWEILGTNVFYSYKPHALPSN